MNLEKILNINVQELMEKSLGSFGDVYCKFAILQNRIAAEDELPHKQRKQLPMDYKIFRDEVARRVENCRQMIYKQHKYEAWYKEIKAFYELLPVALE